MNRSKILVMYAGSYNIPARDGQDANSGLSIEYYFWGENGETLAPKFGADGISGTRRSKANLNIELFDRKVQFIPAIYEGDFEMKVGSDGKPILNLTDLDFISKVSITPAPEDKASNK